MAKYTSYVYKNDFSLNTNYITLENDGSQHDSRVAYVIAQQYSSVTFV
jgi:very-short-patch-repair endonuclease